MEDTGDGYSLYRESSFYDRMFHMLHRLGTQSNILVSARYTHGKGESGRKLTKQMVVAALHATVKAHPSLHVVAVIRPSPERGRHRLHRALLHVIDVESQVEVIDETDHVSGDAELFARIHASWDYTDDEPIRPFWKLIVVGGSHVVFVFHHLIADGMSGQVFHREFLNALNTQNQSDIEAANANPKVYADIHTCVLPRDPLEVLHVPKATLITTFKVLVCILADLLLKSIILLYGLPRARPYFKSVTGVAPAMQRTATGVVVHRISASTMESILRGCRKNETSFTAVLTTMWMATLSKYYSPRAVLAATQIAADLRPQMDLERLGGVTAAGVIVASAASVQSWHLVGQFRRILLDVPAAPRKEALCSMDHAIDVQQAGKVAKECRMALTAGVKRKALRAWAQGKYMAPDLEHFVNQILPVIGYSSGQTLLVSNLGAFGGSESVETAPWSIFDIQFCAAAVNGNVGSKGIVLNVAGVKGRDTVITAVFEKDVVQADVVDEALRRTVANIQTLVEGN